MFEGNDDYINDVQEYVGNLDKQLEGIAKDLGVWWLKSDTKVHMECLLSRYLVFINSCDGALSGCSSLYPCPWCVNHKGRFHVPSSETEQVALRDIDHIQHMSPKFLTHAIGVLSSFLFQLICERTR